MRTAKRSTRRTRSSTLKKRLLQRHRELVEKVSATRELTDKHPLAQPSDAADQAVQALDDDMALQVAELRSEEVQRIHEALQKVVNGTYGMCEWCGKRISPARLELIPEATLCVECQSENERDRGPNDHHAEWERVEASEGMSERAVATCSGSKL